MHNTRDSRIRLIPETPVLTEADVLRHLRAILESGYGKIEIDIEHHYIRVIRPTPTILGRRPS